MIQISQAESMPMSAPLLPTPMASGRKIQLVDGEATVTGREAGSSPEHVAEDSRGEVDEEPGEGPEDSIQISSDPQLRTSQE
jgi:hypothetical protein